MDERRVFAEDFVKNFKPGDVQVVEVESNGFGYENETYVYTYDVSKSQAASTTAWIDGVGWLGRLNIQTNLGVFQGLISNFDTSSGRKVSLPGSNLFIRLPGWKRAFDI